MVETDNSSVEPDDDVRVINDSDDNDDDDR
jgi:hypothetical protein